MKPSNYSQIKLEQWMLSLNSTQNIQVGNKQSLSKLVLKQTELDQSGTRFNLDHLHP